jgi:hypothetical protein
VFKRLFWLTIGFGSGLGTSWYVVRSVKRTVRRTVEAYAPAQLASRAGQGYRGARLNLRAAWTEGREAMREREVELWARVEAGRNGHIDPNQSTSGVGPDALQSSTHTDAATSTPTRMSVTDELAARRRRFSTTPAGTARSGR